MEGGFSRQRLLLGVDGTVVGVLELDGWDVADGGVQSVFVELPDPGHGGELDVVDVAPRAVEVDALGLVEPDRGLGQGIAIAVADGADRRDRSGVSEPVPVDDRGVLTGFNPSTS